MLHLSVVKRGYVSKSNLVDVIQCVITKRKKCQDDFAILDYTLEVTRKP